MSDPAVRPYFAIQSVRAGGVVMAVYALVALRGRAPWPEEVPHGLAYVLLAIGLVAAFLVPQLLARRWRSPPR